MFDGKDTKIITPIKKINPWSGEEEEYYRFVDRDNKVHTLLKRNLIKKIKKHEKKNK